MDTKAESLFMASLTEVGDTSHTLSDAVALQAMERLLTVFVQVTVSGEVRMMFDRPARNHSEPFHEMFVGVKAPKWATAFHA